MRLGVGPDDARRSAIGEIPSFRRGLRYRGPNSDAPSRSTWSVASEGHFRSTLVVRIIIRDASTTRTDADRADANEVIAETAGDLGDVPVEQTVVEDDDLVSTIVSRSGDHDLTVIGASREGLLEQLVFGTTPEEVGRQANSTTIMAKRDRGLTSQLRRWLR